MAEQEEQFEEEIVQEYPVGQYGTEYLSWLALQGLHAHRGRLWYVIATLGGLGLLIYATKSANFLFALIVLMFGIISYLSSISEDGEVMVVLTDEGVVVGSVFYPYTKIQHFWFIYEPGEVEMMYLDFKDPWKPQLHVDIMDQNPNLIREVIGTFVAEDLTQEEEPFIDLLARVLKL